MHKGNLHPLTVVCAQVRTLNRIVGILDDNAPSPSLASQPFDLVIGIMSARHHVEQRRAQRATWVGHAAKMFNKR